MERLAVENVSKRFNIGLKKDESVLQKFISFLSGRETKKYIWALRDVSFSAESGEIVGIIGYNGSGKSTLLRVISGIHTKDHGSIKTKGRIVPMMGGGVGFSGRLSMKDNIYLSATFLGMSQKEIKSKFNTIVDFSGIGEFMNTKLYKFSSGMVQKLAFSISVHSSPKLLLLDEIFEVGDKNFKDSAANKIRELVKGGTTVLFVTHDIENAPEYCDRIIWLHQGKIVMEGEPKRVCNKYMKTKLPVI